MSISREDVQHVALLARLELTEEEIVTYTKQLNSILEYAETLNQLDTSEVPPTAHVLPLHNVFREDQVEPSMDQKKIVQNAPQEEEGFFRVPRIV